MKRILSLLVLGFVAHEAVARDLYKKFLDPGIPNHKAILDTLEKLKSNPKDAGLHNDLGCLVARDGFWRDALREFGEAGDLDRKDGKPFFNAGLVHAWKEEWGAARRSFAKATDRDPGNWTAWWMLGFAEERLGNANAAVDAYKVSVRYDTTLFEPARNPYAAQTKLKARALLETYERRVVRASMPIAEQLADSDRIAAFFQKTKPHSAPATDATPDVEVTTQTGPVVNTTSSGSGGPPPVRPPRAANEPPHFQYAPPRGATDDAMTAPAKGGASLDPEAARRYRQAAIDGVSPDQVPARPATNPTPAPTPAPGPGGNFD